MTEHESAKVFEKLARKVAKLARTYGFNIASFDAADDHGHRFRVFDSGFRPWAEVPGEARKVLDGEAAAARASKEN